MKYTLAALLAFPAVLLAEVEDLSASLKKPKILPAVAVARISDGELSAIGAKGVRVAGEPEEITIADKFHIGSCGKSMTATLVATFVEDRQLSWESTLSELLPGHDIHEDLEEATMLQLLSHTAGVTGDVPRKIWAKAWADLELPPAEARENLVRSLLKESPELEPGTAHLYSNGGYAVAGYVLEVISGESFEDLMTERLFEPLGMESAGFGAAATDADPDQPWGHESITKPHEPGPGDDNPPAISPAGCIHCSLPDLAKYAKMHLLDETGLVLKSKETFEVLHRPVMDDYALGWMVVERPWGGGTVYTHAGSNTLNYFVWWIAPNEGFAVLGATNTGEDGAYGQLDAIVGKLIP